jgi:hypothetical protein
MIATRALRPASGAPKPYPASKVWHFHGRRHAFERSTPLCLVWEVNCDPISDSYLYEDADADELLRIWLRDLDDERHPGWAPALGKPYVHISWYIEGGGCFETTSWDDMHVFYPDLGFDPREMGNSWFDTFSTPVDDDGEPINWLRLPVVNKLWTPSRMDKGGFIQSATGWKPSAFQPVVNAEVLAAAVTARM